SGSELEITSAGVLTFASAPDYETKSSYTATVTATDGTNSTTQAITVNVTDVNDNSPVFTSSATFSAAENQFAIGTVTATDADGDSVNFLFSGSELAITSAGVLTFKTNPDYETKSSYTLTVTASDGTNTTTQAITVNVTDVNDNSPVFTSSATFSAAENQTAINTVTATDADGDDVTFTVSGSELAITSAGVLTFASAPDYETKATYTATVTASDGTNSTTQNITVNVTDVNEAPVFTSSATFTAAENQTAIGSVTATDGDGDNVTFTVSGSELAITSAGVLTFASAPNYETKSSYTATVTASDGTNSTSQEITVNVTDVNEVPVFTSSNTFSAAENQTAIGSVTATDADGDSITFTVSGSELAITSAGVLTFVSAPDYETKSSYTATVTATDGANPTTQDITVNVTNVNEAPSFTSNATFSAAENQTAIGTVTAVDVDGDSVTFTIFGSELAITSAGVLTFASAPDYETKSSYTATVTASDGTNSTTQAITVNITDVNDNAPVFTSAASFNVDEGNTSVATVTTSDADANSSVTYSLSGANANLFIINNNGALSFATVPDFENDSFSTGGLDLIYNLTVVANDGVNNSLLNITVEVMDINEAPSIYFTETSISRDENTTLGFGVSASDPDFDGDSNLSFYLTGPDASEFTSTYSETSVQIEYAANSNISDAEDGDNKSVYNFTVNVTDSFYATDETSLTDSVDITLTINNVNDNSPAFTSSATFSAAENQTAINTVTASDVDGDNVTFTVSGSELAITSAGVLTFASAPNYETKSSYTATVTASDGTNSTTQAITVNVTNVNDVAPAFTSSATFSAAENQTAIGTVAASDVDGDNVTFTVSGSELAITSAGVLTFASAPNYETKSSYTATVTASDGTNSTTQNITISITNLNDNSPQMTLSTTTFSAEENQTAIGTITALDADGDAVTFSVSGSELEIATTNTIFNNFGVLTFASAPDYETKSSYTAVVTASDGTYTQNVGITVNVTDVNEAPSFASSATFSAAENQTAIGTIQTSDVDGDTITYSISGSEININASTGVLTFASAPDYETKTSFTATVTASDGTNSTTQNITVNVNNVNDNNPSFSSSSTLSMTENTTAIGSLTATDVDGDSITFSISGTDAGVMTVNSTNGVLTFNSAPDYETKSSYSLIATATDGINSTNQNVTIDVVDDAMFVASQDNTNSSTGSSEISDSGFNIDFADNIGGTKDTYSIAIGEPYFDEWLSGEGRYQENVGRAYGYSYDNSISHSSLFLEQSDENWEWGTNRGSDVAVADSGNGKMLTVVGVPGGNYPYSDVSLHLTIDDGSVNGSTCTINLEDINGVSAKLGSSSARYVAISGDGRTIALGHSSGGTHGQIHFLKNTNVDPYSCNAIDSSANSNWTLLDSLDSNLNGYFDGGGGWGFKLSHNGRILLSQNLDTSSSAATMNVFYWDNGSWIKYNPLTQDGTLNVTNSPFLWAGRDSIDMNSDGTIFAVGSSDGNVYYVTFSSSLNPSIASFKTNGAERRSDINTRTRSSIGAVELNQDGSIIAIGRDSGCVDIQKNVGNAVFEFYGEICSQVNATYIDNIEFNSDMTRIHWTGGNANGRIHERFYLTEINN
ncbi:cadherin repeat domain-containing protein, partial [Gammaproteobacteria bacterium]|nr:cadherin repeat domain-containing protein [Gammaproteobacteria bacterium]